jgi:hypothetical protein
MKVLPRLLRRYIVSDLNFETSHPFQNSGFEMLCRRTAVVDPDSEA